MNIVYAVLSLGTLGILFGIVLGFASSKFAVELDPKIPILRGVLPGSNCGGCGFPGCDAFAQALIDGEAGVNGCPVGGARVAKALGEILGVDIDSSQEEHKKVVSIHCNGSCSNILINADMSQYRDCIEAHEKLDVNESGCSYRCVGLGTCVTVCQFDALYIEDGIAKVNEENCVNCGACVKVCPRGLIETVSIENKVRVLCNSKDSGKTVRTNCSVGCIGCKICEKNCPHDAIHVNDLLARIDYDKCTNCGICVEKCPTKAIVM